MILNDYKIVTFSTDCTATPIFLKTVCQEQRDAVRRSHLVWPKYPNALLCLRLRLFHTTRFILNFTALSPILIIHESRLGKGERGMDWKKLLGSITTSVDEELQLRNAYLAAENRLLRKQITGRVQLTDNDRRALAELGQKLGKQVVYL